MAAHDYNLRHLESLVVVVEEEDEERAKTMYSMVFKTVTKE